MIEVPSGATLSQLATGRVRSLFADDYEDHRLRMSEMLRGARVLLIGGAGSIGGSVARLLAGYETTALHILDANENSLVELTRDLRAGGYPLGSRDLRWMPLDFGSAIMRRTIEEEKPYDYVLNFAAVKHVRSEKDTCSVLRMLDVNVLMHATLLDLLADKRAETTYFSVSTDKAANPVNLMGASKRLMEHVMFSGAHGGRGRTTSARFANVAFSDGSLLQGWLNRIAKRQPIAVPRETRRFFVSIAEAGELCMLAAFCQDDRRILVPRLIPDNDLRFLDEVARAFIVACGLEPAIYTEEGAAIRAVEADVARGRYPLLLTPLDTSGEKPYEEFVGEGEKAHESGFSALHGVEYLPLRDERELSAFMDYVRGALANPRLPLSKAQLVAAVGAVLPEFSHVETHRKLDERV